MARTLGCTIINSVILATTLKAYVQNRLPLIGTLFNIKSKPKVIQK